MSVYRKLAKYLIGSDCREAEREAGGLWAAVRSLAESPSFNLVLTITMLVLTAMLASFLLLCIVAMRRRMRHADADGSRDARHSKRARRKCAPLICI